MSARHVIRQATCPTTLAKTQLLIPEMVWFWQAFVSDSSELSFCKKIKNELWTFNYCASNKFSKLQVIKNLLELKVITLMGTHTRTWLYWRSQHIQPLIFQLILKCSFKAKWILHYSFKIPSSCWILQLKCSLLDSQSLQWTY